MLPLFRQRVQHINYVIGHGCSSVSFDLSQGLLPTRACSSKYVGAHARSAFAAAVAAAIANDKGPPNEHNSRNSSIWYFRTRKYFDDPMACWNYGSLNCTDLLASYARKFASSTELQDRARDRLPAIGRQTRHRGSRDRPGQALYEEMADDPASRCRCESTTGTAAADSGGLEGSILL
jgi:hypothetical protein